MRNLKLRKPTLLMFVLAMACLASTAVAQQRPATAPINLVAVADLSGVVRGVEERQRAQREMEQIDAALAASGSLNSRGQGRRKGHAIPRPAPCLGGPWPITRRQTTKPVPGKVAEELRSAYPSSVWASKAVPGYRRQRSGK